MTATTPVHSIINSVGDQMWGVFRSARNANVFSHSPYDDPSVVVLPGGSLAHAKAGILDAVHDPRFVADQQTLIDHGHMLENAGLQPLANWPTARLDETEEFAGINANKWVTNNHYFDRFIADQRGRFESLSGKQTQDGISDASSFSSRKGIGLEAGTALRGAARGADHAGRLLSRLSTPEFSQPSLLGRGMRVLHPTSAAREQVRQASQSLDRASLLVSIAGARGLAPRDGLDTAVTGAIATAQQRLNKIAYYPSSDRDFTNRRFDAADLTRVADNVTYLSSELRRSARRLDEAGS